LEQMQRVLYLDVQTSNLESTSEEHKPLVHALETHNEVMAREIMHEHIEQSKKRIFMHFG